MWNDKYCTAVIVAGGKGKRMCSNISKQYILLDKKPVLYYTIKKFEDCSLIDEIIVVVSNDDFDFCKKILFEDNSFKKVNRIVLGGNERQYSVFNGLKSANPKTEIAVIHDGVRPFININDIEKTIIEADKNKACVLGVKAKDTIKICSENIIKSTPDRNNIWYIQTPQTFDYNLILNAHKKAEKDGFMGTDDSVLVERLNVDVFVVSGSYDNIKITTPEDLYAGEILIKKYSEGNIYNNENS